MQLTKIKFTELMQEDNVSVTVFKSIGTQKLSKKSINEGQEIGWGKDFNIKIHVLIRSNELATRIIEFKSRKFIKELGLRTGVMF